FRNCIGCSGFDEAWFASRLCKIRPGSVHGTRASRVVRISRLHAVSMRPASRLRHPFSEAIADAAHRLNVIDRSELSSQSFYMHINGAFQDNGAIADGSIHELMPCERPARLTQHAFEEPELRRRQFDILSIHLHSVPDAVKTHAEMPYQVRRL